jgi:hypothetical protein
MTVRQPRYGKEEFTRRGDEIYESQVRSQVEADNRLATRREREDYEQNAF